MRINEILKTETKVKERIFSVSEFLDFLNERLRPCLAIVQGEVGEKVDSYPRYTFFNLLDKDGSILKCFAWDEVVKSIGIPFEGGLEIRVIGYPEMRKDRGELKFQVQRIELVGEGILKKQFEILKRKLEALGFFDQEIKKPIPRFCEKIGLITSKYGKGALKDFKKNLGNFSFQIFFYDVRVEGIFVVNEIIKAINWFNQNLPHLDVLVLTRGGGDWESLQPFNSEEIVKAIRASRIPIITGIGHEDDITLADLAADLRCSTPTHAAKILSESWKLAAINVTKFEQNLDFFLNRIFKGIKEKISFFEKNLTNEMKGEILSSEKEIDDFLRNLNFAFQNYFKDFTVLERDLERISLKIPKLIENQKSKIENLFEILQKNKTQWERRMKENLKEKEEKLKISSPLFKLKQGYTITVDEKGKIIKDPSKLKVSQIIKTKFYKGQVLSKVKRVEKNGRRKL